MNIMKSNLHGVEGLQANVKLELLAFVINLAGKELLLGDGATVH